MEPGRFDEFPFWAKFLPPFETLYPALRDAPALKEDDFVTADHRTVKGLVVEKTYPDDYHGCENISRLFSERAQIQASFQGCETPWQVFCRVRSDPAFAALPAEAQREEVYSGGRAAAGSRGRAAKPHRECNTFSPSLAAAVYRARGGHRPRVVDFSAGWGDRLLGAAAAGAACYHGCDPNPLLHPAYCAMVAALDAAEPGFSAQFALAGAERYEPPLGEGGYDVALLSPPFFTLELYVEKSETPALAGTQSTAAFPQFDRWVEGFLRPYYEKAFRALRPGGWLVAYITDVRIDGVSYPLEQKTREVLQSLGGVEGAPFGLRVKNVHDGRRPPKLRPAWCWFRPPVVCRPGRGPDTPQTVATALAVDSLPGGRGLVREDRHAFGYRERLPVVFPGGRQALKILAPACSRLAAMLACQARALGRECRLFVWGRGRAGLPLEYARGAGVRVAHFSGPRGEKKAREAAAAAAAVPLDLPPPAALAALLGRLAAALGAAELWVLQDDAPDSLAQACGWPTAASLEDFQARSPPGAHLLLDSAV